MNRKIDLKNKTDVRKKPTYMGFFHVYEQLIYNRAGYSRVRKGLVFINCTGSTGYLYGGTWEGKNSIALFLKKWIWLPRYVYLGRFIRILKVCTLVCVCAILKKIVKVH